VKTADVRKLERPCGSCGNQVADITQRVQEVCKVLVDGHMGVAQLFEMLSLQATNEVDRIAMVGQMKMHRELAEKTATIVLPDLPEEKPSVTADSK
jgi:hypothetical protein